MANGGAVEQAVGVAGAVQPRAHVFGHDPFSGTVRTRLEANGRLALPATFKGPLLAAGSGLLLPRRTDLLWLFTPQGFDAMVDDIEAKQPEGMLDPETRLRFYKAAPPVTIDRQSRFVIPPPLRALVGLEAECEVVLAGALERIEIWPAERFDAQEAPKLDDINLLLDGHKGLPTGTA